jgi:hypothetical protein
MGCPPILAGLDITISFHFRVVGLRRVNDTPTLSGPGDILGGGLEVVVSSEGHPTGPRAAGFASAVDASLWTEAGDADSVLIPEGRGC